MNPNPPLWQLLGELFISYLFCFGVLVFFHILSWVLPGPPTNLHQKEDR